VTDQVVGHGLAGAEHAQQPHRGALVVHDGAQERIRTFARGLHETNQARQRVVGVGRAREQGDQRLGGGAEPRELGKCCVGVLEAEPQQVPFAGYDAVHGVLPGHPRSL